jgi:uncharacterized phiE125 gp8 family phage protein
LLSSTSGSSISQEETSAEELAREIAEVKQKVHADPELLARIRGVRDRAEGATDRAFLTQTWDYTRDGFPDDTVLELPKPPLQSVTHVKYLDTAGVEQTWPATHYVVEAPAGGRCARGRIVLMTNVVWPTTVGQQSSRSTTRQWRS